MRLKFHVFECLQITTSRIERPPLWKPILQKLDNWTYPYLAQYNISAKVWWKNTDNLKTSFFSNHSSSRWFVPLGKGHKGKNSVGSKMMDKCVFETPLCLVKVYGGYLVLINTKLRLVAREHWAPYKSRIRNYGFLLRIYARKSKFVHKAVSAEVDLYVVHSNFVNKYLVPTYKSKTNCWFILPNLMFRF